MVRTSMSRAMLVAAAIALVPALAAAQGGLTKPKQGQGGSVVKGSAGTDGGKDDNGLEHCDKPMGAMAVVEPQSEYMMALSRYNLGSPISLIRMMVQQSNCFIVVERGQGLRNMEQERALAGAGQTRAGSNIGGFRHRGARRLIGRDLAMQATVENLPHRHEGAPGAAIGAGRLTFHLRRPRSPAAETPRMSRAA